MDKKTIALVQGDPAGIGPELLIKLLVEDGIRDAANLVIIGDERIFKAGQAVAETEIENVRFEKLDGDISFENGEIVHLDLALEDIDAVPFAQVSAVGGQSSLKALEKALGLSQDGIVDGICFMPFNKESMHLGGSDFSDELGFARDFLGVDTIVSEFNVADGMWNGRVTSHVAMKDVPDLLTTEKIEDSILLADRTLKLAGYTRPRIVVAAYNPHAGDGGLMGDEEARVIAPAVELAQAKQVHAVGPLPADTLWLKVRDGEYDAVVTMYHDQGQIAIKLLGFDKGVSVLAGLPVPLTTAAHGTAFDIAGTNKANAVPTTNAFRMALNMAEHRNATDGLVQKTGT